LFNQETNPAGLTDEYLADRAAMLAWKLQFDKANARDENDGPIRGGRASKPYNEDWDTSSIQGNWDFTDLGTKLPGGAPLKLAIDGTGNADGNYELRSFLRPYLLVKTPIRYSKTVGKSGSDENSHYKKPKLLLCAPACWNLSPNLQIAHVTTVGWAPEEGLNGSNLTPNSNSPLVRFLAELESTRKKASQRRLLQTKSHRAAHALNSPSAPHPAPARP
jgi:hypothetical protein